MKTHVAATTFESCLRIQNKATGKKTTHWKLNRVDWKKIQR